MYHSAIEREISLVIMDQIMVHAARLKMSKKRLAKEADISDVYLSNLQSRTKTWRPLTPNAARKIMEVLNYRASQIRAVEEMLRDFKERRTKERHLRESAGVNKLLVQFYLADEDNGHGVAFQVERKDQKNSPKILVVIGCEANDVSFRDMKTKEKIDLGQACTQLFPNRKGLAPFLGSILLTLRDESSRAKASDLDNFDIDEGTRRYQARMQVLSRKKGPVLIIGKARRVFEEYTNELFHGKE